MPSNKIGQNNPGHALSLGIASNLLLAYALQQRPVQVALWASDIAFDDT